MATNPRDVPRHYYSLDEYFALEQASDARFEYWDGDIVCMSGGTRAHYRISGNVHVALAVALRGGRCQAFTGDAPIWTPTLPPYRYPDASAACGELQYKNVGGLDALVNPVVVEVTSPSTVVLDEGPKFIAYQAIPTLREYLLVSQDAPRVTHYTRRGDGSVWERRDVTDTDATLELESIGCALKMRDIYEGVAFTA